VFGYYGQAGTINDFPAHLLAFILPCQLACAMATSLPDEPSDRKSCKRTAPVLLGLCTAKLTIICLIGSSLGFFFLFSPALLGATAAVLLLPVACFTGMIALRRESLPGSGRMGLFVSCAVGANVVLMAGAALLFFNLH
jgi:1,4-dihydroxy-2-naphthoate octaprenyltransferase